MFIIEFCSIATVAQVMYILKECYDVLLLYPMHACKTTK